MATWSADEIPTPTGLHGLLRDKLSAPFWLLLRLYVGAAWLVSAWGQLTDPRGAWVGAHAGEALRDVASSALSITQGPFPEVSPTFAAFVRGVVLPHAAAFSYLLTFGSIAVGLLLVAGAFTGIAAFLGGAMNVAFVLAGTCAVNPLLFVFSTWLVLAWRVAGNWGADRWLLPRLGAPGWPGPREARRAQLVGSFLKPHERS